MRQDPRFADVERAKGNDPVFALGRNDDGSLAAVAWFLRRPSRLIPGRFSRAVALSGPVCDDPATILSFLDGVARHPDFARVDALTITPYWLGDEVPGLDAALERAGWYASDPGWFRSTGLIDLNRTPTEIVESFSRSARRKVRLVEKSDIVIRRIETLEEAAVFFDRLNRLVLERIGSTPIRPAEYASALDNQPGAPAGAAIFGAFLGEVFLGGLLVSRGLRTAHAGRYVADAAAAREVANNLRVAPSLWLAGMLWARAEGCSLFDVEGFELIEDESHPMFNVYEYKREFNPTPVKRSREYTIPLRSLLHTMNCFPKQARALLRRLTPAPKRKKSVREE